MSCKQARTDIALWIGNDLEEDDVLHVERHIAGCPQCREHAADLEASLKVLQATPAPVDAGGSIWPRLAARLSGLESRRRLERFNGWLPAATAVAASVTIIVLLEARRPDVTPAPPNFSALPYSSMPSSGVIPLHPSPAAPPSESMVGSPADPETPQLLKSYLNPRPRSRAVLLFP
jgi:hypothetical protein